MKKQYLFTILLATTFYFGFIFKAFSQNIPTDFIATKSDSVQKNKVRFKYFELKAHTGLHIYTGENLVDVLEQGYGSLEMRMGWYPKNADDWSKYYGNPSYGVGFYSGLIGDPKVLGKPNALFGFVNFPLSQPGKRNSLELSPSLGLTYNLRPFNEIENPNNDAIGSRVAVYFNVHFGAVYQMNREMDLTYGVDLSHFSNGRSNVPNHGLNMFGVNVGLRYNYSKEHRWDATTIYQPDSQPARFKPNPKTPNLPLKTSNIAIYTAFGVVQNKEDRGTYNHYPTFSLVGEYQYKVSNMHGFTAGLDYFRDESLSPNYESSQRNLVGVHAGYDFMFWKMAIRLQAGTYITDDRGKGAFFLRPAFQYQISKKVYAQVGLKTLDGASADWIEFGVGFRPFNW